MSKSKETYVILQEQESLENDIYTKKLEDEMMEEYYNSFKPEGIVELDDTLKRIQTQPKDEENVLPF